MGYEVPTMYFVIIFLLCIIIGIFILVLMGNSIVLYLLSKLGISVFSNKINKDFSMLKKVSKDGIAWIDIPGVCYAPIMRKRGDFYKNHNYIGKFSVYGELVVSEDKKWEKLKGFLIDGEKGITDLTVISGSPKGKYDNLRHTNFSILRKVKQRMSEDSNYNIVLQDINGKHIFRPIAFIEIERGKSPILKYSNRNDFLESLIEVSDFRFNLDLSKKCIILECNTGVDTVLVMLNERV